MPSKHIYGTLKVFLLSAQDNFYIILSSYGMWKKGHVKKNQVWIWCLWLVSRSPKSGCFFGKIFVELVYKPFSGKNNSLEPPVFWFSNTLPCGLEESRELISLIRWVLGNRYSKIWKISANNFFFAFLSDHYGFRNCF